MKIESYDVQMLSSSSFVQKHESYATSNFFTQEVNSTQNTTRQDLNIISKSSFNTQKIIYNNEENLSIEDKIKKRIIELLLEQITNKKEKVNLYPNEKIKDNTKEINPYEKQVTQNSQTLWGFVYESSEEYYEKSTIDFNAKANIKTSNGEFNIDINVAFSQEFHEIHKERLQIGTANFEDPLIINFASDEMTFDNISKNLNFQFDINNDGIKEDIPLLKDKIGFLALDKNQNGKIDNGSELFGPNTGNGFKELKSFDSDKNNWLDENDSIFNHLRVWEKTENGENNLLTLKEAGIGAIYLASIGTDFNYSKSIDTDIAKLKESSIFLKESGKTGIITSVDFTV